MPADIVAANYHRAQSFAYKTKTSFQRDFEKADKPDERDILTGTILRMGRELGIETPVIRELSESHGAAEACDLIPRLEEFALSA